MIAYIQGKVAYKDPALVVLDANGIGYQIRISLGTYQAIKAQAEDMAVKLHTWLHIKEDAHTLYGFADVTERHLFMHLISISGVGPGTALLMLSSLPAEDLASAIVTEKVTILQAIKGIGTKTAARIVLELKDKLRKEAMGLTSTSASFKNMPNGPSTSIAGNINVQEALSALVTLGYLRAQAEKLLDNILKVDGNNLSVEDLVKKALRQPS